MCRWRRWAVSMAVGSQCVVNRGSRSRVFAGVVLWGIVWPFGEMADPVVEAAVVVLVFVVEGELAGRGARGHGACSK